MSREFLEAEQGICEGLAGNFHGTRSEYFHGLYLYQDTEFTSRVGRTVRREEGGFYHCSKDEWQGFANMPGALRYLRRGSPLWGLSLRR